MFWGHKGISFKWIEIRPQPAYYFHQKQHWQKLYDTTLYVVQRIHWSDVKLILRSLTSDLTFVENEVSALFSNRTFLNFLSGHFCPTWSNSTNSLFLPIINFQLQTSIILYISKQDMNKQGVGKTNHWKWIYVKTKGKARTILGNL